MNHDHQIEHDHFCVMISKLEFSGFQSIFLQSFVSLTADFGICSKNQRNQVMRNMVQCAPRDTVVPLFTPPNLSSMQPRHIIVKKCKGSCWAIPHTCVSAHKKNVSIQVVGNQKWSQCCPKTFLMILKIRCNR